MSGAVRLLAEGCVVSTEDLEDYESDVELQLYREYKDVCPMFRFVVETERRFYLAHEGNQTVLDEGGRTPGELGPRDAWGGGMEPQNPFVEARRGGPVKGGT